jgi:hypothetical protein
MERHFSVGVRSGNPIDLPEASATPRVFAVALRLGRVAWVWNTPVGMEITRTNGVHEDVRIVDVTRWALWGLAFVAMIIGASIARD